MKIYFASDFHLGAPNYDESLKRERHIVKWLDFIAKDATDIYLLGDIFDFWHEWKRVVPKGFVRVLGKIAEITDSDINIHFLTGNHDLWTYGYLAKETGMKVYKKPVSVVLGNKKFYLAHGDGLGPNDRLYKFLKKIFTNKTLQWFFARLHPNLAMTLATKWSLSRDGYGRMPAFKGEDEWLIIHSREVLKSEFFDFLIYGHRHIPKYYNLTDKSVFVNLGSWYFDYTYAVFDGNELKLKIFKP